MVLIGTVLPSPLGFVLGTEGDSLVESQKIAFVDYATHPLSTNGRDWEFTADGFIRNTATKFVVDLYGSDLHEGTNVILYHEKGSNNQKWELVGDVFHSKQDSAWFIGWDENHFAVITKDPAKAVHVVVGYTPDVGPFTANQGGSIHVPTLNAFTLSAVVTPSSTAGGRIFDKITPGLGDGWLLDLYPNTHLRGLYPGPAGPVIPVNEKTYVAATYDGATSVTYVNGVSVGSSPGVLNKNQYDILIGKDQHGGSVFAGTIQRADVYLKAFTAEEILQDYQNAKKQIAF